ncbi:MAG TPA: hypothetical protein VGS19_19710, partial [Streptosporangiaceae bacterium]|nr:hypothetical protein [Streptosporangiaceae bacterium]
WHDGCDDQLDDTHLMRMAGRFARRVKAWGQANNVPVIYCKAGQRKHLIAAEHLAAHPPSGPGVFLVLAAKAPASVWEVRRSQATGVIGNIAKKTAYVNHYSFHIIDPQWGHVTIKMSGHPPFPAQVILNGHEYVAARARAAGIGFAKEGNCFTEIADPQGLARVADALSQPAAIGRLGQVCDRWIYTACLCFGLDLAEQGMSGFRYSYTVYQAEYSRNLLFRSGAQMDDLFDRIIDRTRSRLDIPTLRTLFGLKTRPHHNRAAGPPAQEIMVENSQYGLTWFRIRFGLLQCKAYTKGEHVLRFEATVHNTRELRCRRSIDNFPEIITRLASITDRFATTLDCADISFLADTTLDDLPLPSRLGATRVGGIDLNKPRIRAALAAALALAPAPHGFTVAEHAAKVSTMTGHSGYTIRQAAYDLRKLRGKNLAVKPGRTRRYHIPPGAARTIAGLLALRDHIIAPILADVRSPRRGRKPAVWTRIDRDYETLRIGMQTLFHDLGITHAAAAA